MRELPQLDESRCTACGDCVAICPTACLALAAHGPWLIRPRDCTSCAACVAICPTEAVHLGPIASA